VAADLGLPLVVRPSYVLGGRAMQIIREESQLGDYLLGTLPELCGRRQGALSQRQDRPDQYGAGTNPCCSIATCPTPPRSTSIVFATARTPSSSASWSTSKEAGIHSAIPPARCRRIRSTPP